MSSNIKKMVDHYQNSKIKEQTKIREILQQMALLGLERQGFFSKAAFYGGTALRILYGLDRFSEDLDFTLLQPDPDFDFSPFLEGMRIELASMGFAMDVAQKVKNQETAIVSAFMKMNTIHLLLSIGDEKSAKMANHNEKIQIKLEVDIDPPRFARVENRLVLDPVAFYVLTLNQSDLFAGKVGACLYRSWKGRIKGRDWFDFAWYIRKQIPLSLRYLESVLRQGGNLDETLNRDKLIELLHARIKAIDWEMAKADVRAFISEPEQLDIWSASFFLDLTDRLKVEAN